MKHEVDIAVGRAIRTSRQLAGMTQEDLAAHIGVKFQQVQKYETGTNRVSASRLWMIANALNHDISHFFAEIGGNTGGVVDLDRQTVEFITVFERLDKQYRDALFRIAKSMV